MRKFFLIIGLMFVCAVARADGVDIQGTLNAVVPNSRPSVFYSIRNHEGNFITQYQVASKDTKIGTFIGSLAYGESDTGLVTAGYKTETLSKLGVNVIVLKDLFASVDAGAGYDHISKSDRRFDYGVLASFGANIKFGPQGN